MTGKKPNSVTRGGNTDFEFAGGAAGFREQHVNVIETVDFTAVENE